MRTSTKSALMATVLVAGSVGWGKDSHAAMVYDYADALMHEIKILADSAQNKAQVISHFTSEVDAMQLAVVEALKMSTGQLSGNAKEQIQATGQIADTQDKREVVRRIEDRKQQAMIEAASGASTCNVVTGNLAAGGNEVTVAAMTAAVAQQLEAWDTGGKDRNKNPAPSANGTDAAIAARVAAFAPYCTFDAHVAGICSEVEDTALQGASINATKSIFSGNTYSDDASAATDHFIANTVNPTPQGPLPKDFGTTPQGQRAFADRMGHRARTSVAENYMTEFASRRKPLNGGSLLGDDLHKWAEGTAKQVVGYSKNGDNFPNGVSWADWMELRSKAWYMNPDWAVQVDSNNMHANSKDIAMILSFIAYQGWETYKLLEKIGTIEATQLAILNERSRASDPPRGTVTR